MTVIRLFSNQCSWALLIPNNVQLHRTTLYTPTDRPSPSSWKIFTQFERSGGRFSDRPYSPYLSELTLQCTH